MIMGLSRWFMSKGYTSSNKTKTPIKVDMQEKWCQLGQRLLGKINRLKLQKKNCFVPYDKYQDIQINDILNAFIEDLTPSNVRGPENKYGNIQNIWK